LISAARASMAEVPLSTQVVRAVSLDDPTSVPGGAPIIVSASQQMADILALVGRVAARDTKVLITGESGVGKDVIAREIHTRSVRAGRPFVPVNCAGLTETLLESELFGHVKGSFTGAYRDKPGKLQIAHRGTLFLDEVGEMSLRMQALLLRFLENGEVQAVGADHVLAKVDVRVIAATNRNLPEMVAAGQFREDLLYRLRVIHIHVPPLRERREDIRPLVRHLVTKTGRDVEISDAAIKMLERYRWPGNIRELQNVIEQALWMANGARVEVSHLPPSVQSAGDALVPMRERRKSVADELYTALVSGGYSFWEHIHPLFLARDITRHDMRSLVRKGLATTRGNYRALLRLFGLATQDYKRFLNFLAAHDCTVDFREFRHGTPPPVRAPRLLPPLEEVKSGAENKPQDRPPQPPA
jgi:DNA-binding NtrC family response regulator